MLQTATPDLEVREYFSAAVLRAAKIPYRGMAREGSRVVFLFRNEDGRASDILDKHTNGKLRLPTLAVTTALQATKSEMFSYRQNTGMEAGR